MGSTPRPGKYRRQGGAAGPRGAVLDGGFGGSLTARVTFTSPADGDATGELCMAAAGPARPVTPRIIWPRDATQSPAPAGEVASGHGGSAEHPWLLRWARRPQVTPAYPWAIGDAHPSLGHWCARQPLHHRLPWPPRGPEAAGARSQEQVVGNGVVGAEGERSGDWRPERS